MGFYMHFQDFFFLSSFFPLKVEAICKGEGPGTGLCLGQQMQLQPEAMRLHGKRRREEPKALIFFPSSLHSG